MRLTVFIFALLLPMLVLADDAIFMPPEWLKEVMLFVAGIPHIGPIFIEIMKWLGVIASILTAIATAFFVAIKSLQKVLQIAKLVSLAEKVEKIYLFVSPYLKFFSMYNVQKKEIVHEGDSKGTPPVA